MSSAVVLPAGGGSLRYAGRQVPDVDFLEILAARAAERPSFYWECAERGEAVLGFGMAARVTTFGAERLLEAAEAVRGADRRWVAGAAHEPGCPSPVFVGGFSFSAQHLSEGPWRELAPCLLFVPAETWIRRNGRTWRLTVHAHEGDASHHTEDGSTRADARTAGDADRGAAAERRGSPVEAKGESSTADRAIASTDAGERARWCERVERVLAHIEAGRLKKVVLARKAERRLAPGFDAVAAVRALRAHRPQCFTFRFAVGETIFFGSTPELLVRVSGLGVETQALAGTSARGDTPQSDEATARGLRDSAKNCHEQSLVTRGLVASLSHLATEVYAASEPRVLSVPEAHHLTTPVMARLREPVGALAVAHELHPTPAACGTPREEARVLLDAEERDRGWYAGAVGWVAPSGDGELAVALRSAVADGERLVAWAGAGIVAGSQPADELEETEIKLRAVLGALGQ